MPDVKTYKVNEAVSAETHDPLLGRCAAKFDAGTCKPKNEQEEVVLDFLVGQGLAEVVGESKTSKGR